MRTVRPFGEQDIPAVAELHRRVFSVAPRGAPELAATYRRYFSEVFLRASSGDEGVRSLVHEDERGTITGFLGAVPRGLTMNGRRVVAAVSSQFVVDPDGRSQLHGVKLLREFLSGPQDISIADEANSKTRALWEALGGTTALLHSMRWARALRPCRLALSFARRRPQLAPLAFAAGPIAAAVDELLARLPRSPLRPLSPRLRGDLVSAEVYLEHLPRFISRYALRPEYGDGALARALTRIGGAGDVRRVLLRDHGGQPRGVYLYSPGAGGIGHVIQVAGDAAAHGDVLQHLFHDAWRSGALALSGRLDPGLLQALSDGHSLFHRRGPWVLIHARRPELIAPFERGKAFFSGLEGELCLRFHAERTAAD